MLADPRLFLQVPEPVIEEIVDEATLLVQELIADEKQSAAKLVQAALNSQQDAIAEEYPNPDITPNVTHNSPSVPLRLASLSPTEPTDQISQNGLDDVTSTVYAVPGNAYVLMPKVDPPPPHTAWIPVRQNFACRTPYEAYIPNLGPDKEHLAMKAYNIMHDLEVRDSAFDMPSDGEPDENLNFVSTNPTPDHVRTPDSLQTLRLRDARRKATLAIVSKYGHRGSVFDALSTAFGMPSAQHARAMYRVAKLRDTEKKKRANTIRKGQKYLDELMKAHHDPQSTARAPPQLTSAQGALEHFCFNCQMFTCDVHDEMRPAPRRHIPDESKKARLSDLASGYASPCSLSCVLLPEEERFRGDEDASDNWGSESEALLEEGVMMFGHDPCNLAIIVKSKSCVQVVEKLEAGRVHDPDLLSQACNEERDHDQIRKWCDERREKKKGKDANCFDDSCDDSLDCTKGLSDEEKCLRTKPTGQKDRLRTTRRTSGHDSDMQEELGDAMFIPCVHDGPCTLENCTCRQKSRVCMPCCGCNGVRHTYSTSANQIVRKGVECQNTADGCNCPGGACVPDTCGCYVNNESTCSPDLCPCDCQLVDSERDFKQLTCRNFDLWHHKKTFVGKSAVEGMGLFAAEDVKKGDLIGVYLGMQAPFSFSDGVNAIGDVTERTFAFDVRDVMIDGRLFGSKLKFANHGLDPELRNCKAQDVWCQGNAYLRLIAYKDFPAGTEIMFNYTLNGKEDPTWLLESRRQAELGTGHIP
eukprot:GFKZ01013121.1.p1 GENE.GFKZ01013121.1~~GFKZ01013121.1.p1  ORF type:complete len:816 (+),score=101.65 GFKZ01013121.1:188-2449(+)